MTTHIDRCARLVWDYHHVNHTLEPADCVIALGSHDTRVAERGAEVFLAGWAPRLVFSGNRGALTSGLWDRPEAEIFAEVAAAAGVPPERMLIENRSSQGHLAADRVRCLPQRRHQPDDVIHIMVGDLQRLMLYAERGWSAAQEIPPDVMEAYERLLEAGYPRRLVPGGSAAP